MKLGSLVDDLPAVTIDLARRILDGSVRRVANGCIDEPNVMYDADFSADKSQPAVFININNRIAGSKLGLLAFLDFLWIAEEYSKDKLFYATARTQDGDRLFKKMNSLGLISPKGHKYIGYDLWEITGNPIKYIKQIAGMSES